MACNCEVNLCIIWKYIGGEPSLEGFLHQFRHHLQNKAREPQYKYLLVENDPKADYRIPYKDCMYRMYGEDDARAWARMLIELAS